MKIYLAARYSRRLELCGYRDRLRELGDSVTSRWLNGDHQISDDGRPIGEEGEALVEGDDGSQCERAAQLRRQFAREDMEDVLDCDVLVAFTEPPRSSASRGGRHVELGLAIAGRKQIVVVGHRENIFCWLPGVRFFETFDAFLETRTSLEDASGGPVSTRHGMGRRMETRGGTDERHAARDSAD